MSTPTRPCSPKPPADFILQESRVTAGGGIVIRITDPNVHILRYVLARVKTPAGYETARADEGGYITLSGQSVQEISLVH